MAIDSDCEIITSNNKYYNTEKCSNTPNYRYLGEYLAKIRSANLTNEDLGEIDRYFLKTNGFYTRNFDYRNKRKIVDEKINKANFC